MIHRRDPRQRRAVTVLRSRGSDAVDADAILADHHPADADALGHDVDGHALELEQDGTAAVTLEDERPALAHQGASLVER